MEERGEGKDGAGGEKRSWCWHRLGEEKLTSAAKAEGRGEAKLRGGGYQ